MNNLILKPVAQLNSGHDRSLFDCGNESLNKYLKEYALQNQKRDMVRNYVCCNEKNTVVGFYSLTYGHLTHEELPSEITKGVGKYPIPVMLLARLAVDVNYQGKNLGKALLKNAILRTIQAAEIGGLRLMIVHAKDDNAVSFYKKHGFCESLIDPLKMFLPMSIARQSDSI